MMKICELSGSKIIHNLLYEISDFRRSSGPLIWDVKRRKFDSCGRRFGTTYQSHLQGSDSPSGLLGPLDT